MQPVLFVVLLSPRPVSWPCVNNKQGKARHTSQIVMGQEELLQACQSCPAGGQDACAAQTSCSQHTLQVSQSWTCQLAHACLTSKVVHWAYQSERFDQDKETAGLSDLPSWEATSLHVTDIIQLAFFFGLSFQGLSAGHVSMMSRVVHRAYQPDCSGKVRAPAGLSDLTS